MEISEYLDDWKFDFDSEIDEPFIYAQEEDIKAASDDYLDEETGLRF